ncbi:pilus assembly protein PilJ [Acinetobacter guillouiae]|uniref:pilus assembly protein PilJ n=1 Tax=Acinetobacter guillouiae TaxID=106649 RepID=UPI0021CE95DB|nr:pilus assembly protein PilJ [Acinetobacter guillouiae]MCU4491661.1 pilus assembly protein PilJ [Acinetobacter guillouiae]
MSIIKHKNNHIKPQSMKRCIKNSIAAVLIAAMLSACSNLAMDHSVCDLRVLSLQIPRQSQDVVQYAGSLTVDNLKNSQEKFNQALAMVHKKYANHSGMDKMLKDGEAINANIDLLVKHRDKLMALQDFSIFVQEIIPGIQAEYNLVIDRMVRLNYPSTQAIIAKNQVFWGERVLRSMQKISRGDEDSAINMEDFLADLEVLNIYLEAQLKGNTELGIDRVKDAEMREGLESIQEDVKKISESEVMNLLRKPENLALAYKAASENVTKSDEIFNSLSKLESNTQ